MTWADGEKMQLSLYDELDGRKRFRTLQYCEECERQSIFLSCGYLKFACTWCGTLHKIDEQAQKITSTGRKTTDRRYIWNPELRESLEFSQ